MASTLAHILCPTSYRFGNLINSGEASPSKMQKTTHQKPIEVKVDYFSQGLILSRKISGAQHTEFAKTFAACRLEHKPYNFSLAFAYSKNIDRETNIRAVKFSNAAVSCLKRKKTMQYAHGYAISRVYHAKRASIANKFAASYEKALQAGHPSKYACVYAINTVYKGRTEVVAQEFTDLFMEKISQGDFDCEAFAFAQAIVCEKNSLEEAEAKSRNAMHINMIEE